jgi:hypothetical protein
LQAAEVEAVLLTHPDVQQVAVIAVKDELRDEEVLACVVLKRAMAEKEAATALFHHCNERLAYYKPPGWIHIVQSLPRRARRRSRSTVSTPPDRSARPAGDHRPAPAEAPSACVSVSRQRSQGLRTRLEDHVERRFGGPPNAADKPALPMISRSFFSQGAGHLPGLPCLLP